MFPNVRLMIVAVLASIMGISCALGLFAEFRVSHDSFLRESSAGAPLQLSAGDPPAAVMNAAATFGVRFAAQPSPSSPPAVDVAAGPQAVDHAVAVKTPPATPSPRQEPEPPLQIATAPQPAAPSPRSDTAPEAASPAASSVIPGRNSGPGNQGNPQPKPADNAKPADNTPAGNADNKPGENKPSDNLADRTPATALSGQEAAPVQSKSTAASKITPERASAAAVRKRIAVRHRPVIARRVPRTRAVVPTQSFTATQPLYQWTPPGQTPSGQTAPPVRRRPIVRRTRPIPNAAQTPQPALSNTSAANAPE